MYRAHRTTLGVLFFGPSTPVPVGRFDAPDGSYKVCYVGLGEEAAFVEGVLHQPVPSGFITTKQLKERSITRIEVVEPLKALRFYGTGLLGLGADASLLHGPARDYARSQLFALEAYLHEAEIDGLAYTCRHDDSALSLALFDRAKEKVEEREGGELDPSDVRTLRLLDRYGLGILPDV